MFGVLALDLLGPAIGGGAATLGFAPFGYYGLTWLAITVLVALWWNAGAGRAAWRGFVFGCAHFGTGVYWTFVSTYDYGGAPLPLAIASVCLLTIYLALYPMAVGAFAGATRGVPRPVWALMLVPSAWLLGELVRGWVLTGFPWLSLGYSMIDAPGDTLAPIGGVYCLGFLIVAGAGAVLLLLAGSLAGRVLALALIAAAPFALWRVPEVGHWTHPVRPALSVDLVQGNFGQASRPRHGTLATMLKRYRRLTRASHADLVIWPETAIPVPAARMRGDLQGIDALARGRNQTVLAGILRRDAGAYTNAVLALGASRGHYYQRHRVAFADYFPVPALLGHWLDVLHLDFANLGFGADHQRLIAVDGVKLGIAMCFEDVFGDETAEALPAAGILVDVTNDAGFARTTAAAQHLQIARMRALEAGRPMARAANTGVSAIIDYDGRVRQQTAQFTVATLSGRITPRAGQTPYIRTGDEPLWIASAVLVALGAFWAALTRQRAVT